MVPIVCSHSSGKKAHTRYNPETDPRDPFCEQNVTQNILWGQATIAKERGQPHDKPKDTRSVGASGFTGVSQTPVFFHLLVFLIHACKSIDK